MGLNSFVFEIDILFSTYYDYKASRIIAHNMLQNYLQEKVNSSITKNTRLLQF
ncbi:RteC domain-containing protein, partial [Proteus vulgaris]|uniref:RteC domain-containing protein n=1 Tax=Proteus vulgaris TaxID=585 RepID=UPI0034D7B983